MRVELRVQQRPTKVITIEIDPLDLDTLAQVVIELSRALHTALEHALQQTAAQVHTIKDRR